MVIYGLGHQHIPKDSADMTWTKTSVNATHRKDNLKTSFHALIWIRVLLGRAGACQHIGKTGKNILCLKIDKVIFHVILNLTSKVGDLSGFLKLNRQITLMALCRFSWTLVVILANKTYFWGRVHEIFILKTEINPSSRGFIFSYCLSAKYLREDSFLKKIIFLLGDT